MKSRHRTRTKLLIGLEIFLLILLLISVFINSDYAMTYLVFAVLLLYNLKAMTETVTIDKDGITIDNWFTIEKRKYNFDQFDTVVRYIDPIETLGRLDLYLLKDNVIFCKIRGRNYDNLDDLIIEIEKLKGTKD